MKRIVRLFICSLLAYTSCNTPSNTTSSLAPIPVIFETDMGNDVDDALALDMLYKYADQKKIRLLAINSNKNNISSPEFIDIMNTWYGHPDIPVGKVVNGANSENDAINYTQVVRDYKPPFKKTHADSTGYTNAVLLYRKLLSEAKDHSVVIISVGFSTNLARLLDTKGDHHSALGGAELVKQKVKLLSVMAGNFEGKKMKEYNVVKDVPSARKLFREWPGQIVVSPFEVGEQVKYPASSIEHDFAWAPHHPVVIAYRSYAKMPYDRQTWDLTSVLYAIEGRADYFSVSQSGTIAVTDDEFTSFTPSAEGNHSYLKINAEQAERVKKRFVELITSRPANALTQ